MEKYAEALAALGGMTGLGGLIDILLYRDRKRIEKRLIAGWVWFEDVKFSNFGWKEAEAARNCIDRFAGATFWSMRRFWFTLGVHGRLLPRCVLVDLLGRGRRSV